MLSAWGLDIERFAPELTFSIASAEQREQAFTISTDVVILNTDGVRWLADKKHPKRMALLKGFDHLIVDESTAYKEPNSQRSKAMVKVSRCFTHRYLMTGTPNPNSVTELWNQAFIVDGGKRLGESYYKFRNAAQVPTQIGPGTQHLRWDDKPGIAPVVDELIRDITIRHAFEDVMTHVPANFRETKAFTLNKKTKALYDQMEASAIIELGEKVISAVHAASIRTKILQIASGALYTGAEDGGYEVVDRQRYELIAEIVAERAHSLVFFNWRHQRDELVTEFKKAGITYAVIDGSVTAHGAREAVVADYQAGKYQTLLLHPRTGAHGLTLTCGTTTIIASPIYEADLLQQAIARIHRGGQTKVTNTILVRAEGTVEELVYDKLFGKEARMGDLLGLLKARKK